MKNFDRFARNAVEIYEFNESEAIDTRGIYEYIFKEQGEYSLPKYTKEEMINAIKKYNNSKKNNNTPYYTF